VSRQRKSTMVELVQELEKLPWSPQLAVIIEEAKAGEYHDYKNQKYVCGKVAAVARLEAIGLSDIADRIKKGEFDEEADAQDKAVLLRDMAEMGMDPAKVREVFGL
jgi:ribosome assembly protein YihI (activator of Der GTPase)